MTTAERQDRWAWRARLKRRRATAVAYRAAVAVVGGAVLLVGVVAIPAPGPGWALVFLGLAILGSEFEPFERLLTFAKRQVTRWTTWIAAQPLWFRGLVALATAALVLAIFWGYLALNGVPTWLPDAVERALHHVPGLG